MEIIVSDIGPIIASVVVALVGWGVAELSRWIRQRYKNERLSGAIDLIGEAVSTTVRNAEVTIRPTLSDGKLTASEITAIKATVANDVKRRIGPAALKIAKENLTDLDEWINAKTEAEVFDIKINGGKT